MSNGSDAIVIARNVEKTYDGGRGVAVHALKGIDLTVTRAEVVAIMGPSGCGKTTLLNCLSGIDEIDSGEVLIDGLSLEDMDDNSRTDHRAREMGFVFQLYNLLPVLNSVENVELPMLVSGVNSNEARKRSLAALERVGLADWAAHKPAELSGGQRQRVTIARALVNEPAIIWADEPTGDLDRGSAEQVLVLLERLNKEMGKTILMVTHDPLAAEHAREIVHLDKGRLGRRGGNAGENASS